MLGARVLAFTAFLLFWGEKGGSTFPDSKKNPTPERRETKQRSGTGGPTEGVGGEDGRVRRYGIGRMEWVSVDLVWWVNGEWKDGWRCQPVLPTTIHTE